MSGSPLSPKLHQDGTDTGDHVLANSTIMVGNELRESMECRNGSVESTDSSHFDDEEQFQIEHSPRVEQSSFSWNLISQDDIALPALRREYFLPNTDVRILNSCENSKFYILWPFKVNVLPFYGNNLGCRGRHVFESEI